METGRINIYLKMIGLDSPGFRQWTPVCLPGSLTLGELLLFTAKEFDQKHLCELMDGGELKKGYAAIVNGKYCCALGHRVQAGDKVLITVHVAGG